MKKTKDHAEPITVER